MKNKNDLIKSNREKEINLFIKKLKEYWLENKDLRFGQVLVNLLYQELKDYNTSLLCYLTDNHILSNIVEKLYKGEKK